MLHFAQIHMRTPNTPGVLCALVGAWLTWERGPSGFYLREASAQLQHAGQCVRQTVVPLVVPTVECALRGYSHTVWGPTEGTRVPRYASAVQ